MSKEFNDYLKEQSKEIQEAYQEVKSKGKLQEVIDEIKRIKEREEDVKELADRLNKMIEDEMIEECCYD